MKKTFYVFKNLGVWKSSLFLILNPIKLLREAIKKLDDLHSEIRWQKKIIGYLTIAGLHQHAVNHIPENSETKEYFRQYGFDVNTDWSTFFEHFSGIKSKYYIPEDLYYRHIEPCLINTRFLNFYGDKNFYDLLFDDVNKPQTFLRFIDTTFYSSDYAQLKLSEAEDRLSGISDPWLIKPSVDSGNGRNIKQGISKSEKLIVDGVETTLTNLAKFYGSGFIVQEKITSQSKILAEFHPESLNTFRIMTLRLDNQIYAINSHLKFGSDGAIVDNTKGVWCGINNNGLLSRYGMNTSYKKIYFHPNTGKRFNGTSIEHFGRVLDFAKSLHNRVFRSDLVSWDIGLSEADEPIFIECNTRFQGITAHQVVNGPLFGKLTDEVMAEVANRREKTDQSRT